MKPPAADMAELVRQGRVGMKRRLLWSFGAQAAAIGMRVMMQLVLVPVLIREWGSALYQDWIVIVSATGFLSLLDFGVQIYFSNALLITWSRREVEAYRRYVAIWLGCYAVLLLAALILLAGATVLVPWKSVLGTAAMAPPEVLMTAGTLAVATLMLIPFAVPASVYRAHGDYGLSFSSFTLQEGIRGVGMMAVVLLGGSPVGAGWIYLFAVGLSWIIVILDQRRRYGELPPAPALPSKAEARTVLPQSALYSVPMIASTIMTNGPILLLAWLGTRPGAVVAFSVARIIAGLIRQIVTLLCVSVGAEIGRQHSIGDMPGLRQIFINAGRLTAGVAGLLGGLIFATGGSFIRIWTGGMVDGDPWLIGALIAPIILTAPALVAYVVFLYINKPRPLALVNGIQALLTLFLSTLLIGRLSALGAALGIGIAEWLSVGMLLLRAAAQLISLPLLPYLLRTGTVAVLATTSSWLIAYALAQVIDLDSLRGLLALGILWAAIMAAPGMFLLLAAGPRAWILQQARRRFVPSFRIQDPE